MVEREMLLNVRTQATEAVEVLVVEMRVGGDGERRRVDGRRW